MEKAQFKSYQFPNHVECTFLSPYRLKGFKSLQVVPAVLKKTLIGHNVFVPRPRTEAANRALSYRRLSCGMALVTDELKDETNLNYFKSTLTLSGAD